MNPTKNIKLESIQALRGVAVLLVIAFHFRVYLNGVYTQKDLGDILFSMGEIGVDIFFVISGFIITYSTMDKEKSSPIEFAIKRFFRLYPVFFIVLSVMIYFDFSNIYTTSQIIKSYLLIPNDYNFTGPWYGYNIIIPAWTLTYEIWFYMIFCISLCISHKYRTIISSLLLVGICSLSQFYFRGFIQIEPIIKDAFSYSVLSNFVFISNPIVYDFIYGMIIAEIFTKAKDGFVKNVFSVSFISSVMLVSIAIIISGYNSGPGAEKWGLYSFMLVCSIALMSRVIEIYNGRFLIFIGEISYSLYINHMVIYGISYIYFKKFDISISGFSMFFILILLTICVSIITYLLIEKPSVMVGRKLITFIRNERVSHN
ncbi:acyltransferase [Budviciaceae bacterium BWR-B9]|uniref:Acyltransferase n=1 Tax=Limnobaculum allomyrinae TaxID=2791986 RepID=A0ABS1IUH8_9GAMM|nr:MULTISPECIES: acyltransferase [Limnobaculum]MBK5145415.1 acyltransferase [Limnobaculum allomyrinae]MBV7693157.1 acyltransferase [Limnobaculum sp. M2-1]